MKSTTESTYTNTDLPESWNDWCRGQFEQSYFQSLVEFLDKESQTETIFPPAEDVYTALTLTPFDSTRVLILGQDPYHDDGQAHGLCFSVRHGIKVPPSLKNIYKELNDIFVDMCIGQRVLITRKAI